jgi:hypothetical protein
MSDMTEIAASKLGQERGNAQEKTFAGQMITDHTKTSEELKSMAPADAKAAIPTSLDSSAQSKIDKLKNAQMQLGRPQGRFVAYFWCHAAGRVQQRLEQRRWEIGRNAFCTS